MPSLLGTDVAANYGRMISPENYTVNGSNVRTWTGPYTQFGTRQLKFLKVVGVHSASAIDFSDETLSAAGDGYTAPNSLYSKALRAIQTMAEVYAAGIPDAAGFIVIVAADTENNASVNSNGQEGTYNAMEAVVKASVEADTSITISALTFDGVAIS